MFFVLPAVKELLQYMISRSIDQATTDVLFHIECFSSLLFLTPQRITSIKYTPRTCEDLMHRLTVVRLLLAIFKKNVQKFFPQMTGTYYLVTFK